MCPDGTFIPKRSDAKYCDNVCRANYHFQLHKAEGKEKYRMMSDLKIADSNLKLLYKSCQDQKLDFIPEEVLKVNKIPLHNAIHKLIDKKLGNTILWFYDYGVMGIEKNKFKIVKKTDYGKL